MKFEDTTEVLDVNPNQVTKIVKRDGEVVNFDFSKISLVIDWATSSLNVDAFRLKKSITSFVHDNISTNQIQDLLVNNALSYCTIEEPDWRFVASRLMLLNMYKQAKRAQGYEKFGYGPYLDFVKQACAAGIYDPQLMNYYSEQEIEEVARELNPNYDFGFDYGGMLMLTKRYLQKKDDKLFELPQQMYMSIALWAASKEPKSLRVKIAKEFYHAIGDRMISPATPINLNLRRKGTSLSSCFIIAVDDSLDSIYQCLEAAAQISKNAGGVGVNLTRIRSHGSRIKGVKGASSGVRGWIKLFNDTCVAVNQLGSRAGAITLALDVWHRDIMEFFELQTENGDIREKAFDIFPQMVINDLFIETYKKKGTWYLFDPHEVRQKYGVELAELWGEDFVKFYMQLVVDAEAGKIEFFDKIDPSKIMRRCLEVAVETGMPYWANKDTINKANPNKHAGMIGSVNLCVESFSNFSPSKIAKKFIVSDGIKDFVQHRYEAGYSHVCNLVSPNVSRIEDKDIEKYARVAVRFLDNLIDISTPPTPETQRHNDDYRILGIGCIGYQDRIIKEGLTYSEAEDWTFNYFERWAYYALDESCNLARDRGRYKHYEGSDWSKGIFFGKSADFLHKQSRDKTKNNLDWLGLWVKVQKYGIRNGGLFAVAPNTGTAGLMGCSASMLPIYDRYFQEKNSVGVYPVVAQFLSPETFWRYETFKDIDQRAIIRNAAAMQSWIDQGISMELMLNMDTIKSATELRDLYLLAMDSGCKTVYYLRSKTKKKVKTVVKKSEPAAAITKPIELEEPGCSSCAN